MYSKITHTIVEEHFGHPTATNIKKSVDKNPPPKPKLIYSTPDKFRADVTTYMTQYINGINRVINSVTGTDSEMTSAEEAVFKNIDSLGDLMIDIYPAPVRENVNQAMRAAALAMIQTVHLMRSGLDIRDWTNNRFNNLISNDLAQTLSAINNVWSWTTVRDTMNAMTGAWVAQAKARLAKNSVVEQQQQAKSLDTAKLFAKVFADGVIQQHPEAFLPPPTMTVSTNRDIM